MLIYNVTSKVTWSIHDEWLQWLLQEQLPAILQTGFFLKYQVVKMLQVEDEDGPTYAVQLYASSLDDYENYQQQHAPLFMQRAAALWGSQVVHFSTLMEVVN